MRRHVYAFPCQHKVPAKDHLWGHYRAAWPIQVSCPNAIRCTYRLYAGSLSVFRLELGRNHDQTILRRSSFYCCFLFLGAFLAGFEGVAVSVVSAARFCTIFFFSFLQIEGWCVYGNSNAWSSCDPLNKHTGLPFQERDCMQYIGSAYRSGMLRSIKDCLFNTGCPRSLFLISIETAIVILSCSMTVPMCEKGLYRHCCVHS